MGLQFNTRTETSHPIGKGQRQDGGGIETCLIYSDYLVYNDTALTPKCAKLKPSTAAERKGQEWYTWG
jgi:hypothetical protein